MTSVVALSGCNEGDFRAAPTKGLKRFRLVSGQLKSGQVLVTFYFK